MNPNKVLAGGLVGYYLSKSKKGVRTNPYPNPPPINSSLSTERLSIGEILKVIFPTSYFRENEKDKEGLVDDWKIVNLMRVIGAILGWMLLAWQPGKDHSDGK